MSKPNRWLWIALGTMWFAMITRISGDFLPKIRFSHYAYGAVVWIIGVLIWAWKVLGKVWVSDAKD
jgi:predicted membrane channel-forming protein YqfA (hemolysin III family)